MARFEWNPEKDAELQHQRGVGFTDVVAAIEAGGLLCEMPHPNQTRYPNQWLLVVTVRGYAYIVPCVVEGESYFLKTI